MNCFLSISANTGLYIYTQERELYQLSLPIIRTPRPRLLYRGYLNDLTAMLYKGSPIFLFRNIRGQVVLLYSADDESSMEEILLLETGEAPKRQYQDLRLEIIQGRLFFFYSWYRPEEGTTALYYSLPFEQLAGTLICTLGEERLSLAPPPSEETLTVPLSQQAAANPPPTPAVPVPSDDEIRKLEEDAAKALSSKEQAEKETENLREVIEKISAQYNELYDYTLKLQEEAKRLKKLAENETLY